MERREKHHLQSKRICGRGNGSFDGIRSVVMKDKVSRLMVAEFQVLFFSIALSDASSDKSFERNNILFTHSFG